MTLTSVSVTDDYFKRIDLSPKKQAIFLELKKIPKLKIKENSVWESRYWGKGVGAFQIEGTYEGRPAIIKIQGAKPKISEALILQKLHLAEKKEINFPKVLHYIPWDEKRQFEIVIFEKIRADFIVYPHQLAKENQVSEFFHAYSLYRKFLQKLKPFIKLPKRKFIYTNQFLKWRKIRLENKLNHLITPQEDKEFLKIADHLSVLFQKTNLRFQHCHLSVYDIKKTESQYYFFSNLFWGFRWPYYDAVFGFMWYLLGLADFEKEKIIDQIHLWHKFIFKIGKKERDLISFALMERYLAALNLDVLMINDEKKIIKMKEILLGQLKILKKSIIS